MTTKLTLRLDESLIYRAKKHSKKVGKSLSQMVADYFRLLNNNELHKVKIELPPVTLALKGIMKRSKVSKTDYKRYLEDKYL